MKQRRKESHNLPLVNNSLVGNPKGAHGGADVSTGRPRIRTITFWIGLGLAGLVVSMVSWVLLEELWTRLLLPQSAWLPVNGDVVVPLPFVPLDQAKAAIVSLHRGYKFHGHLGEYLEESKRRYAHQWGYAYANQQCFSQLPTSTIPTQPWHLPKFYDKLRFLLWILRDYPNLTLVLWMDGDALVTNPEISLEDRANKVFPSLHSFSATRKFMCMVWGQDNMPNAGVMLFYNTPVTRALLTQALEDPHNLQKNPLLDTFFDQASLLGAIQSNQTYTECTLLLKDDFLRLLQSRTRTWSLYRPGDWILHLPNHNRFELVRDLSNARADYDATAVEDESLSAERGANPGNHKRLDPLLAKATTQ